MGMTVIRNKVNEANSLSAAIIVGLGNKVFAIYDEANNLMVLIESKISTDQLKVIFYKSTFKQNKNILK